MNKKFSSLFVVAAMVAATSVQAHGIWFAQRSDEMALIYGEGAEDGSVVKRLHKVKGIAAYDSAGVAVPTQQIVTDRLVLADMQANPAVLTGILDNGYYTTNKAGEELEKGKSEVPDAVESGHYWKYTVRLMGDLKAPLGALPGQVLQVTPVGAALPRAQGEALPLQVLYNGKPVAGVEVLADFVNDPAAAPQITDANGIVTVKVRNNGLNVIYAKHEVPAGAGEDADIVQHAATLAFVLPEASH
jgi:uncharacterized GH25 family protein